MRGIKGNKDKRWVIEVSQDLLPIQMGKLRSLQIDAQIRELKLEAVHEDLLTLQQELSLRSATIERVLISKNCRAIGKSIEELSLPSSVRVVTVFRGPFLVPPSDGFVFRPDDVAIIVGLKTDLEQAAFWFTPSRTAQSA